MLGIYYQVSILCAFLVHLISFTFAFLIKNNSPSTQSFYRGVLHSLYSINSDTPPHETPIALENSQSILNKKDEKSLEDHIKEHTKLASNINLLLLDKLKDIRKDSDGIIKITKLPNEVYLNNPEDKPFYLFDLSPFLKNQDELNLSNYKKVKNCFTGIHIYADTVKFGGKTLLIVDGTSISQIGKTYLALLLSSLHCLPIDEVKTKITKFAKKYEDLLSINHGLSLHIYDTIFSGLTDIDDDAPSVPQEEFSFKKLVPKKSRQGTYKSFYGFELDPIYNPPVHSPKVAVLVSGGVDSSVALWLLKSRGFNVHGFHLKVNLFGDDPDKNDDLANARSICDTLGVPFHVIPMHSEYKNGVFEYMIDGYRSGMTPNPDVLCNKNIKFGAFLDLAVNKYSFDIVASGHYANVRKVLTQINNGKHIFSMLSRAYASDKDQSYFLSRLSLSQLSRILCPLGNFPKDFVRLMARINEFKNHSRPDSMGICFLNNFSHSDYLKSHFGEIPGSVVDYFTKKPIGQHTGLYNYTIGQRISIDEQYVVVSKDVATNTLYVTDNYSSKRFKDPLSIRRSFSLAHIRWIHPIILNKFNIKDSDYMKATWEPPITNEDIKTMQQLSLERNVASKFKFRFKLRNGHKHIDGNMSVSNPITTDTGITQHGWVTLTNTDIGLATGQYAAMYNESNVCVGSGIIVQSV